MSSVVFVFGTKTHFGKCFSDGWLAWQLKIVLISSIAMFVCEGLIRTAYFRLESFWIRSSTSYKWRIFSRASFFLFKATPSSQSNTIQSAVEEKIFEIFLLSFPFFTKNLNHSLVWVKVLKHYILKGKNKNKPGTYKTALVGVYELIWSLALFEILKNRFSVSLIVGNRTFSIN